MAAASSSVKQLNSWKVMGGFVKKFSHQSSSTKTEMKFSIFFPPSLTPAAGADAAAPAKVPAIYWLSGLTCTDDNFMQKAGAFRAAAAANVAIICPDTSPRGANLGPEEKASWDFGEGAGFYLNATTPTYAANYRMADYVFSELPALISSMDVGVDAVARRSIFGHSMGGHGALVTFLRNPGAFRSVSAFAPIANPCNCDWGRKAFKGYLGGGDSEEEQRASWKEWDATELLASYDGPPAELLIEQGAADDFLAKGQLLPEKLIAAAEAVAAAGKIKVAYNLREGYDHSYFFIATFVEEHIQFHAKHLYAAADKQ